ncbi:hypothetical protein Btru_036726 [Bulinus truncatus]|nr:hypothetical protein Btru_036726 [Bulinus truncatus]
MSSCSLVSQLVMFVCVVQAGQIYQHVFKVTSGYRLTTGTVLKNVSFTTITPSLCVLLCHIGCGSATFSLKNKICVTFLEKFYNFNVLWTKDPNWLVMYRDEPIQYEGWTLIFRGQSAINIRLSPVWREEIDRHDDRPLSSDTLNGCYRLDNLGGCKQHFRSYIIDNWRNITQVKFATYQNGIERNNIVFDGSSSNNENWFRRNRILTSSWSSLKTNTGVLLFDIFG